MPGPSVPPPAPEAFVSRIRAGDIEAFEAFHRSCYATVWRFAYSYTHSRDAADEVVQDAFVRVWERREQLDPGRSLLAYLYRLIRNAVIDRQRHARVVHGVELSHSADLAAPGMGEPAARPDTRAELAETKALLAKAIAALPEQRRAALLLRWQHDMPYEEIADALGVTPAAARQLVTRAREAIRAALAASE